MKKGHVSHADRSDNAIAVLSVQTSIVIVQVETLSSYRPRMSEGQMLLVVVRESNKEYET